MSTGLLDLLQAVERGELSAEAAIADWERRKETDLGFAVVDDDRAARTGAPEVIYGAGKTPAHLARLLDHLVGQGHLAVATRVEADKAAAVAAITPVRYDEVSRLLSKAPDGWAAPSRVGSVCLVAAGTSDLPVAEEAGQLLEWYGWQVHRVSDVGVAGVHRLLKRVETLRSADVVIAVAGMEGALPSVVGGLVRKPVIAVPTSVGYGSHLGGLTPLLAMLNSCASGVVVVNIDNGFGAAQAAHRILLARAP